MQCICLQLTVHVMLYAERGSRVAVQKDACFVLVVVVGIGRGKKWAFLRAAQLGKCPD